MSYCASTAARLLFALCGLWLLSLLVSSGLAAQVVNELPGDSALADSLAADTIDQTARYLEAQEGVKLRVPVAPLVGVDGPEPPASRVVFDREAIDWANAETLADLMQQIPGVYLWRGGWIGRPEVPNYQGRGATSVEYYLDGLPFVALGVDSIGVDPSLFALSLFERVEIERLPGLLRVHLFTPRHDRRAARSRIGVSSGDRNIARYLGGLERRFANGLGVAFAAEYFTTPTLSGARSDHSISHLWLQGSYLPSPKFGLQYQIVRMKPNRRAFVASTFASDTIGEPLKGNRSDAQIRLFLLRDSSGLGPRLDLLYGRSGWEGSGIHQQSNQFGGVLSWRTSTARIGGSAFIRSKWTSLDLRGEAGWTPIAALTTSAEVGYQTHDADRQSYWFGLRGGLRLPLGVELSGALRQGSILTAPALLNEPVQDVTDFETIVGWQRSFAGVELGFHRTDAFRPQSYQAFRLIDSLRPVGRTDWLTAALRISPRPWITLEGWYSEPRDAVPEGIPPKHSLVSGTIRSKFLRTFPSGAFDLKLQLSMESWSTGVIGRDAIGAPIKLRGATFFRNLFELRLQRFIIYWDRVNLTNSKQAYVPGFPIPGAGSTFGVRWEFLN